MNPYIRAFLTVGFFSLLFGANAHAAFDVTGIIDGMKDDGESAMGAIGLAVLALCALGLVIKYGKATIFG